MGLRGSSQPGRRAVQPFRLNRGLHAHGWAAPQGQFSLLALGDASLERQEGWPLLWGFAFLEGGGLGGGFPRTLGLLFKTCESF